MALFTTADFLYEEPLDILQKEAMRGKSEMSSWQQSFLCGLMKQKMPHKILEVGVSAGGTTAVLLNCMEKLGLKDSHLYSIDLLPYAYQEPEKPVGYVASEIMAHMQSQWTLYTSFMVAHWIEKIGEGIDFVVLDAAHMLPGELLDFIIILPFLAPQAIVVLHDVHLFRNNRKASKVIASHVLFHSVVAEKLIYEAEANTDDLPNIAAFRVTPDTLRYREQLFYALSMPWQYQLQGVHRTEVVQMVRRYYSADCVRYLENCIQNSYGKLKNGMKEQLAGYQSLALWGAGIQGQRCAIILQLVRASGGDLPTFVFLDQSTWQQGTLLDCPVLEPIAALTSQSKPDAVIVCVADKKAQEEIVQQLDAWGYRMGENAYWYTDILEN